VTTELSTPPLSALIAMPFPMVSLIEAICSSTNALSFIIPLLYLSRMEGNYNNVVKLSTLRQAEGIPFDDLSFVKEHDRPAPNISMKDGRIF
jgi:hypothetical protein